MVGGAGVGSLWMDMGVFWKGRKGKFFLAK